MKPIKKSITYGRHTLTLETGEIARQAHGAVMVTMNDTVVLVTVVGAKSIKPGQDFFPLTVDYQEKFYAAGRIPGSFFKREGRPSEKETLTSRLIDRPIRPLFPEGFYNEVQIVATVMSADSEVDSDIPSIIGTSAALILSGIPFDGPLGAARVGYINNEYILNPTVSELKDTKLNLVVAGTQQAVLMVESDAMELSEEVMLGAVNYGHEQMQTAINAINDLVREAGKPEWDWQAAPKDEPLIAKVSALAEGPLREAYQIRQKGARSDKLKAITKEVIAKLAEEGEVDEVAVGNILFEIEEKIVRMRQVWLLPSGGQNVKSAIGIEKVVWPHAQHRKIAPHHEGALPQINAEKACAIGEIEGAGEASIAQQRLGDTAHEHEQAQHACAHDEPTKFAPLAAHPQTHCDGGGGHAKQQRPA